MVVTRAAEQQGEARELLEAKGANVLDLPALVIVPPDHWGPLDDALADLDNFHWLVFSSANGVLAVEQRLQRQHRNLCRLPKGLKIAAVGRKTARLLEELGAPADFVPPSFVAESLIDHFPVSGWGLTMLLPRVQHGGRTVLADAFGEAGVRVVEVAAGADQTASGGSRLLGVLTVGTQKRALFAFGTNLGEICVGPRGHCSADHPLVLPEGWSVLTIDDQNGCVQLAENGKAQDLLCIT